MSNPHILLLGSRRVAVEGLRDLLASEPGFLIVGAAGDWWSAVRCASENEIDVCIIDVSRPDLDGALATRRLRQVSEGIRVIAIADDHDLHILEGLLRSGINAYILRRKIGTDLVPAIEAVIRTGVYLGDPRRGVEGSEYPAPEERRH